MQTAAALTAKMQAMTPAQQRELFDFADFLVSRRINRTPQRKSRKSHLLAVSVWSDNDISSIDAATEEVNTWTLTKY